MKSYSARTIPRSRGRSQAQASDSRSSWIQSSQNNQLRPCRSFQETSDSSKDLSSLQVGHSKFCCTIHSINQVFKYKTHEEFINHSF